MEIYYGSDQQIALQKTVDESTDWCLNTKGAVNGGRFLGTDDPDAFGWSEIFRCLEEGGAFTFRMVPIEKLSALNAALEKRQFRFDYWNVFSGPSEEILDATDRVLENPLPDDLELIEPDALRDGALIHEIQAFMTSNGIAPFTGKLLANQSLPSSLIALRNRQNRIVATAFGYIPYNKFSKWDSTAWGGLVSVDPSLRGKKFGLWINAKMLNDCVTKLGATAVQEYAAETNVPSRKMIEHCGLELDTTVVSGIATSGEGRFTK